MPPATMNPFPNPALSFPLASLQSPESNPFLDASIADLFSQTFLFLINDAGSNAKIFSSVNIIFLPLRFVDFTMHVKIYLFNRCLVV